MTIFGTNIGPASLASGTFTGGQLATTAGGVQVTFDGTLAPVLYARSNQVGVIVPFEVAGKSQTSVQLTVDGRPAPPIQQPVSPTSPGIYTTASTGPVRHPSSIRPAPSTRRTPPRQRALWSPFTSRAPAS